MRFVDMRQSDDELQATDTEQLHSIRETKFLTKNIAQDNADPCAAFTVTITLSTSAPLYTACSPQITIEGLRGSAACASDFASVGTAFALETFNAADEGTLVYT